jgi:Iap family predicted aminopeptidase
MKKIYLSGLLVLCIGLFTGFQTIPDQWDDVFKQINEEELLHGRAYETLQEATSIIGHRLTGSENGKKAEAYTYSLFKKYGIKDVKYLPFEVESWMRDTVSLEIVPKNSDNFRQIKSVALAHSPVSASVQGLIVDVGNGLQPDFERLKEKVKGKVVLVNLGILPKDSPLKNLHRSEKAALAIEYGATGAIFINQYPGHILLTGTASVTGQLISIPAVCISWEDGLVVRDWLKQEPRLEAHIGMHNFSKLIKARNVVATIKGSQLPKEKIVIGGHLDSWDLATGAIDNGIGSFTVIEVARIFQALKLKPKRTIEFVMFMGEEQGLLGSEAIVKRMTKDGSINQVKFMVNLDMAGNPIGFNASGWSDAIPFLSQVGQKIKSLDTSFHNVVENQAELHSDHESYMLEGIPVLQPVSNLNPSVYTCYHANCDDFSLIDKTHISNSARFTAMLLYALADADQLPVKRMSPEETKNFMVKNGLKNELVLGKKWKWGTGN